MEFKEPITIQELVLDSMNIENMDGETGMLVACRPCDEQYKNKTYLGFYLGELPAMQWPSVDKNEQKIRMMTIRNPAMYIPEINKIIWGAGSWWRKVKTEEDFREITDSDIDNVWYVRLAKKMFDEKKNEEQ